MASEVLYRKWRPQTLGEVVGQEMVTTTLRNAVKGNRVGHAYLFCGPRGTGKTSTGRILAKAVNCENPAGGEPCNACAACVSISDGRCLDVIEIDAASNRGVDDIRQLRERVNYASGTVPRKVYIVDEVHMLTDVASNALLKTLEEPPPHVIFILATTEFHKVLSTIVSRCQSFHFRRLALSAIAIKLRHVCEREGIQADDESLAAIARAAGGSLRDAENLLQQLMASHGRQLSAAQVREVLGIADESYIIGLIREIFNKDLEAGLRLLHRASEDGVDMRHFGQQVVAALRDLLLIVSGCEDIVEGGTDRIEDLKRIGDHGSRASIAHAVRRFAESGTRDASQPLLSLELAFVDSVLPREELLPATDQVARSAGPKADGRRAPVGSERLRPRTASAAGTTRSREARVEADSGESPAPSSVRSQPDTTAPTGSVVPQEVSPGVEIEQRSTEKPEPPALEEQPGAGAAEAALEALEIVEPPGVEQGELGQVRSRWKEYVDSLRGFGSTGNLDAFLRSACEPAALEDDVLVLRFAHDFHKRKVEDPKYRHIVEERLFQFYGRPYKVRCMLDTPQVNGAAGSAPAKRDGGLVDAAIRLGARPRNRR